MISTRTLTALLAILTPTFALPTADAPSAGTIAPRDSSGAYTPGWCTFHITQYQRNETSPHTGPNYTFDITLYDFSSAPKPPIGQIQKTEALPIDSIHNQLDMSSDLPQKLTVLAGNSDQADLSFKYGDGGQWWSSSDDSHCKMGNHDPAVNNLGKVNTYGYEDGKREGDCGFECA